MDTIHPIEHPWIYYPKVSVTRDVIKTKDVFVLSLQKRKTELQTEIISVAKTSQSRESESSVGSHGPKIYLVLGLVPSLTK